MVTEGLSCSSSSCNSVELHSECCRIICVIGKAQSSSWEGGLILAIILKIFGRIGWASKGS